MVGVKDRDKPLTMVTRWDGKALINQLGDPRMGMLRPNIEEMSARVLLRGTRLAIVSSGDLQLGRRALRRDKEYSSKLADQEADIRRECGTDRIELKRRLSELRAAQERRQRREGQKRLMGIWGHEFGKQGITVSAVLLDGADRDFTQDILLSGKNQEVIVFNHHGSLYPKSVTQKNDVNLRRVVEWVEPDDSTRKLVVLSVTGPNSADLSVRRQGLIPIVNDILVAHPYSTVAVSAMEPEVVASTLGESIRMFLDFPPLKNRKPAK